MKVVLTADVKKLGYKGEILEVSPGYARNFLFPKRFAIEATGSTLLKAMTAEKDRVKTREEVASKVGEVAASLKNFTLLFTKKMSSETHLYGSVGETDIVEALKKDAKIELEKTQVEMEGHIKEVGKFTVKLHLPGGTILPITVEVKGEGEPKKAKGKKSEEDAPAKKEKKPLKKANKE